MTGFTSIPNEFFRADVLSELKEAELKILLATFRKTYGWIDRIENGQVVYKLEDDISYSQYREMTGLSDASIASALKKLIQKGYMTRVKLGNQSGQSSRYKIRIKGESPDEWNELDSDESTGISETIGSEHPTVSGGDAFTPDELFGRKKTGAPEPRKGKGSYTARIASVWKDSCRRKGFGSYAQALTNRDLKHVKDLVAAYDEETVLKATEFFVMNFKAIAENLGITSGEPTLPVLWGFRASIFPMAKTGVIGFQRPAATKNKQTREFNENKFGGGGGDFWQT
jgi:hypothetical protein